MTCIKGVNLTGWKWEGVLNLIGLSSSCHFHLAAVRGK
jgi:hypothetical protein